MISKVILAAQFGEKMAFLAQNSPSLSRKLILTLFFEKNVNILAENWRKSPKIVFNYCT
jgi:hypothetical protein